MRDSEDGASELGGSRKLGRSSEFGRSRIVRNFWLISGVYLILALPVMVAVRPSLLDVTITVLLGLTLVALSVIDIDCLRLPDVLTLPLVGSGLGLALFLKWDDPIYRVGAALVGYGVLYAVSRLYERTRGRAGLGLGDAKLFAAAGAWVGFEGLATVLLCGSLSALVWAGYSSFRGQVLSAATALPFGPFLAFGLWSVWLYGPMALGV